MGGFGLSAEECVDGGSEGEVFFGEAAGVVGDEGEADAAVADVDVGMVAGLLSGGAYAIDEGEGGGEVGKAEGAGEFAGLDAPGGHGRDEGGDLVCREWGHGVISSGGGTRSPL